MPVIFEQCRDPYGGCIRQYVDAGCLFLIFLISSWSTLKTYKKHEQVTFQFIPLSINSIVTLFILSLQIFYQPYFNTHIIFMFVEFFTYYVLSYALIALYWKNDLTKGKKVMKKINLIFKFGSAFIVLCSIAVTILSFLDILPCNQLYWIPSLMLLFLELPIFIVTLVYCSKTKEKIRQLNSNQQKVNEGTLHFFKEQDSYVKLKIFQTNLFQITFSFSMLLHLAEIILYKFTRNQSICLAQTNQISVRDDIQLWIMIIKNLSELFPHLMIPLIFWYLPNRINREAPTSLYITAKIINTKIESNYKIDDDQEEIHKKLIF